MLPGKARTQHAAWKRQAGSSSLACHGVISKQDDKGRDKQRDENHRAPERFVPYYLHNAVHLKLAATLRLMHHDGILVHLATRFFDSASRIARLNREIGEGPFGTTAVFPVLYFSIQC